MMEVARRHPGVMCTSRSSDTEGGHLKFDAAERISECAETPSPELTQRDFGVFNCSNAYDVNVVRRARPAGRQVMDLRSFAIKKLIRPPMSAWIGSGVQSTMLVARGVPGFDTCRLRLRHAVQTDRRRRQSTPSHGAGSRRPALPCDDRPIPFPAPSSEVESGQPPPNLVPRVCDSRPARFRRRLGRALGHRFRPIRPVPSPGCQDANHLSSSWPRPTQPAPPADWSSAAWSHDSLSGRARFRRPARFRTTDPAPGGCIILVCRVPRNLIRA